MGSFAYPRNVLLLLMALSVSGVAQKETPKETPPDDVVRVNTELVQADVMVFDKQGRFVEGLAREQFQLNIDGKSQPISFFDQVRAGSSKDRTLAVNGTTMPGSSTLPSPAPASETRGRTIVFFIDDLHLSLDSLGRTRKTLNHFIDTEMNANDQVAIASTSGVIGFLQQFTDNKAVLRAAVGRLVQQAYNVRDMTRESVPMSEYAALTIERKDDPGVTQFYVEECLRLAPKRYPRSACEIEVINRARLILLQAASVVVNTYEALESLMLSSANLQGRKLVFFISDGFLLDTGPRNADPRGKLAEITDAAVRAGVVIYTIDARGLFSGQLDATNNVPVDMKGRMESVALREIPASQDALNALAGDTGGRALRNQNYFDRWVDKVLDETSNYYILAWRPNNEEQATSNFRNLTVRIIGHPEYVVRLPKGFSKSKREATSIPESKPADAEEARAGIQEALKSAFTKRGVPTSLSVVFLDTPQHGPVLTGSVRIANEVLSYAGSENATAATVDVAGVVINDRGKMTGSFQTRLRIDPPSHGSDQSGTIYNYRLPLKAGLYQVRVVARDSKTGQVGSAQQWIEIPELASHQLALSSILLGLQTVENGKPDSATTQVQFSVDHRFRRISPLRFLAFVYNAAPAPGSGKPQISFQARLIRNGQIIKSMSKAIMIESSQDLSRIPFAGEIALDSVAPGQYVLEIEVEDQIAKTKASQQAKLTVE